jgi:membrane protein DedA with SNARE-associated domain
MDDWVIRFIDAVGPLGIFVLMFLETVFPPIPSEVIMPVAGVRAANGQFSLWSVIVAGSLGAMAGNTFWYLVARIVGIDRFHWLIDRHGRWLTMQWGDVEKVQRLFGRFGGLLVMFGRMIPTIRSVISIPAGLVRMAFVPFLIWSTLGTAIWSAGLAVAGYLLGQQFSQIEQVIGPISSGIIVLIVLLYIYRQATWKKREAKKASTEQA